MIPTPPVGWWLNPRKFRYELRGASGVACWVTDEAVIKDPETLRYVTDYHFGGKSRPVFHSWEGET